MNVSSLLDELDEMIDSAWNMPLSGGKALVDAERVREIVDKIRSSLPQEIRQAKAIVSDRSQIIADAKREAETVVRVAEERARVMVNQDEIVRQAQARGSELLSQSQTKAREIRRAANEYVDDLMKRTDEQMTANLAELRKTRQNLKRLRDRATSKKNPFQKARRRLYERRPCQRCTCLMRKLPAVLIYCREFFCRRGGGLNF